MLAKMARPEPAELKHRRYTRSSYFSPHVDRKIVITHPIKMFELSGFLDAITAGNWRRQKSSGNPLHQALACHMDTAAAKTICADVDRYAASA